MARQMLFDFMQEEQKDQTYTTKTTIVQYQPSNEKVELYECFDRKKFDSLVLKIKQAHLPKDIERFLIFGATRHIVFNFKKIADYYVNAPQEVQDLFEDQALVIIDYNNAYERGFIELNEEVGACASEDYIKW